MDSCAFAVDVICFLFLVGDIVKSEKCTSLVMHVWMTRTNRMYQVSHEGMTLTNQKCTCENALLVSFWTQGWKVLVKIFLSSFWGAHGSRAS